MIPEFEINNLPRVHHFLAQIAHESAGFRYLYEIWGPTRAQRGYEGRRDLGNTVRGDGYRYRGRGYMMLTGRANYRAAGKALGLPLEAQPDLAARPQIAARVAGWYWTSRNLNHYADKGDAGLRAITYRINGGYNGLADRQAYYGRAKRNITSLDGGRMSWAKTIIAASGDKDGRVAAAMYETLAAAGIDADVAREWAIQEAHAACMATPVGSYDFIVLGGPARAKLPDTVHRFVLPWTKANEERTDYRSAVGSSYRDTYAVRAPQAMEKIKPGLGRKYIRNMQDQGYKLPPTGWEEEEEEVSDLEKEVGRALAALRARMPSHYEPWGSGDGWKGVPIFGDRLPTIEESKRMGGVCSTALNIACHVNGITPPGEWKGGTGAWGALAGKIGERFTGPGTILRPGDIVGSPYKSAKLSEQGHVAIVSTPGLPRQAKVIQWDAFGGLFGRWSQRKGRPGLNELRTVAQTNALLARPSKWTYIIRRERLFG